MAEADFAVGDLVFAKVRGYPAWPAKIVGTTLKKGKTSEKYYNVVFYKTYESGACKVDALFPYATTKEKLGVPQKRKHFNDALEEIEKCPDIVGADGKLNKKLVTLRYGASDDEDRRQEVREAAGSRQETAAERDEDYSEGELMIDESPALKGGPGRKRKKASPESDQSQPAKKVKRPVGRPSREAKMQMLREDAPTPTPPPVDITTPEAERVSRSGRKIKPKRFADESFEPGAKTDGSVLPLRAPELPVPTVTPLRKTRRMLKDGEKPETPEEVPELPESNTPMVAVRAPVMDTPPKTKAAEAEEGPKKEEAKKKAEVKKKVVVKTEVVSEPDSESQAEAQKAHPVAGPSSAYDYEGTSSLYIPLVVKKEKQTDDAKEKLKQERLLEKKHNKVKLLSIESRVVEIDLEIKTSLHVKRANCDKCIKLMDELALLCISPLMLKKNPEMVDTVKKLRRYVGNVEMWTMTEEEKEDFNKKAEMIRQKGDATFHRFKDMFVVPDGQQFNEVFNAQVERFQRMTEGLSDIKRITLTDDPTTA